MGQYPYLDRCTTKIHKFFIDFYFPFVYDSIAKYGIPYFEERTPKKRYFQNNIMKEVLILWQILI